MVKEDLRLKFVKGNIAVVIIRMENNLFNEEVT